MTAFTEREREREREREPFGLLPFGYSKRRIKKKSEWQLLWLFGGGGPIANR